jgi:ParB family chromosome partitioning protein
MTKPPRGLGRGLGALIPQLDEEEISRAQEIPIQSIKTNPFQPRKEFDSNALNELAESIREHGIIQPLLVRDTEQGYQLIAGERRWRAAQIVGLKNVPVVIRDYSDQQMMEVALVENIQRENLNPMEEAQAYQRLIDEFSLTQEIVAQKVGKSRPAVANTLRLLQLPQDIQRLVLGNAITMGHARTLLSLNNSDLQRKACQEVIQKGLSVRETEEYIRRILHSDVSRETEKNQKQVMRKKIDPHWKAVEERLVQHFGTKALITRSNNGGKIEIQFFSDEEFERILEIIFCEETIIR